MPFLDYKVRLKLTGTMPERALLRLRRAKIPVYEVVKTDKNELRFCARKNDLEKIFAIYPKVCYNIGEYAPYTVTRLGAVGVGKWIEGALSRIGFCIGVLLFGGLTAYCKDYAFDVEFSGSDVYAREAYIAMEECGIELGKRYRAQNADLFCAKMISLSGVEFCSIKKVGLKLRVDVRTSPVRTEYASAGVMQAKHAGKLTELTVLRGTALKKTGDEVTAGETLVGDWFLTEGGEQVRVELIARARISCTYASEIAAADEQTAFAEAYLNAGLGAEDTIEEKSVEKTENGYLVTLVYTAIESMNF